MTVTASRDSRRGVIRLLRNRIVLYLPRSLAAHYATYATSAGLLASAMRNRLHTWNRTWPVPGDSPYEQVLQAKARFADAQAKMLVDRGFTYGQLILNFSLPHLPASPLRRAYISMTDHCQAMALHRGLQRDEEAE